MGLVVGLLIAAVGLVLALAVHPTGAHQVNVNTVGWILFVLGLAGMLLDLLLWSEWGPRYMRRRTTLTAAAPGYPVRRRLGGRRMVVANEDMPARRTVVEEEVTAPAPPPGY
jgi:hypothetical protein